MQCLEWNGLDAEAKRSALARPAQSQGDEVRSRVGQIIEQVKRGGDSALRELTREIDGVEPRSLKVTQAEFEQAGKLVSDEQKAAMERAIANVRTFHEAQLPSAIKVETVPGVLCEQLIRPLSSVGLYVPAGTAPLPSAVIMLAIPAGVAGCARRVIFTPPDRQGNANAAVLVAARMCAVTEVYKVGGAQAIAAMAYGTESIPRVDKIFGPGNAWVTAAKMAVATDPGGCVCDMPAGPSEIMVVADESAEAELVASDLLSQAEHGTDSQVVLVSTSRELAEQVQAQLKRQLATLPRAEIAAKALQGSRTILVENLDTAMEVVNAYAPEHLILQVVEPRVWLAEVDNAGSVFLGPWTPESVGDYCSGTNHVLPTYGYARSVSGLSIADFVRRMTVQELSPAGLVNIGPVAQVMAEMEGLRAHAEAVTRRLARLSPGESA